MGAGASAIPDKLDEAAVKKFLGEDFDAKIWMTAVTKGDGASITKAQLEELMIAGAKKKVEESEKAKLAATPSQSPEKRDLSTVTDSQPTIDEGKLAAEAISALPTTEEKELAAIPDPLTNGKVKILYSHYTKEFDIINGSTTQEIVDEDYSLTFVMPNCRLHLSKIESKEKTRLENENDGQPLTDFYVSEKPLGVYQGLQTDTVYYIYVEQNDEQLKAEKKRIAALRDDGNAFTVADDSTKREEGCSCLYGNPCQDKYVCKDWNNRNAVAKANGWSGF
jgi:hypothetical protein